MKRFVLRTAFGILSLFMGIVHVAAMMHAKGQDILFYIFYGMGAVFYFGISYLLLKR